MKIIKSKGLAQKIITSVTLMVLVFNVMIPTKSKAIDWGGALWTPIQELVCGLSDVVNNILQKTFIKDAPNAVFAITQAKLDADDPDWVNNVAGFLVKIPGVAWISSGFLNIFGGGEKADGDGSGEVSSSEIKSYFNKEMAFPSIYYSIENIFANKIPAFDVNFINPSVKNPTVEPNGINVIEEKDVKEYLRKNEDSSSENFYEIADYFSNKAKEIKASSSSTVKQKEWADETDKKIKETKEFLNKDLGVDSILGYKDMYEKGVKLGIDFSGLETHKTDSSSITAIGNIASEIQGTIATWYNSLKNLAIVAMLSILVYIAIRIIIASASEEAKYKIMLKDWLVAVCLLFVMHYIMAFSLQLIDSLTQMLNNTYQSTLSSYIGEDATVDDEKIAANTLSTSVRLLLACSEDLGEKMGYTIMYTLLTIYTIMFTWQYLKRVIYMAFLTIIAPLVAITYPIDKINDGKAQGFNMWIREYIFNLLLQPLHLLLFIILATSAIDLFETNIVYSLVVLGFLLQSIKILKKFFGFDSKAPIGGGGLAGGFAGGAIFSTLLNATKRVPSIGSGGKGSKNSGGDKGIRTANNFELPSTSGTGRRGDLSAFAAGVGGTQGGTPRGTPRRTQGGTPVGTQGGAPGGTPVGTQGGAQGGTPVGTQGGAQGGTPVGTPRGTQGGTPVGTPRGTQGGTTRGTQGRTQGRTIGGGGTPTIEMPKRRTIRGIKNVAKKYLPKAGKSILKLGAGIIGAGTLGTIGVAAGLASENYEDIAKYGIAGLAGGYATGNLIGNNLANIPSAAMNGASNFKDTYNRGAYGRDYDEIKENKQYKKNKEVQEYYKKKHNASGDWRHQLELGAQLREMGIKNQKDIDKALGYMNNDNMDIKEAADLMKFKENVTIADLRNEGKRTDLEKQIEGLIGEGNTAQRDRIMSYLDDIFGMTR